MADDVAGLLASLRRLRANDGLVALIAGDRTGRALPVALETARGFSGDRAAVLVDLGATQDWLVDILYREEPDDEVEAGLADLAAGRAGFGEVIRRDLSTDLDVVLAGRGDEASPLDEPLTAFAAAYGVVVLHASDWRGDRARAAAKFADVVVVVAPAGRAAGACEEARAALGDACPTILAFPIRAAAEGRALAA